METHTDELQSYQMLPSFNWAVPLMSTKVNKKELLNNMIKSSH